MLGVSRLATQSVNATRTKSHKFTFPFNISSGCKTHYTGASNLEHQAAGVKPSLHSGLSLPLRNHMPMYH